MSSELHEQSTHFILTQKKKKSFSYNINTPRMEMEAVTQTWFRAIYGIDTGHNPLKRS